ncbi:MAG: ABC transporter permease [Cryomorphaceae bacterium]|nr:ABC transporter permease [Flavobacteriales bacterium]
MPNLGFYIARRYLISRKSLSIISVMSLICMLVVAVVTMAMVVVLSAFNGIEKLIDERYRYLESDLSITAVYDKVIGLDSLNMDMLRAAEGVDEVAFAVEEFVLAEYERNQRIVKMKGVEDTFIKRSGIDSLMFDGVAEFHMNNTPSALIGIGVKYDLNLRMFEQAYNPLRLSALQRGKQLRTNREGAFNRRNIPVAGIFSINIDFDSDYVIVPLGFATDLLGYDKEVSQVEVQLKKGESLEGRRDELQEMLGPNYLVKSRLEKNELVYKTNKTEKWATFVIMGFILLIATFNIIAALTLLINEKRNDIKVLSGMGAPASLIKRIFFIEGALINAFGAAIGLGLGLLLVYLQQHYGLIRLEGGLVDFYPVAYSASDMLAIFSLVVVCGLLSSVVPVQIFTRRYGAL